MRIQIHRNFIETTPYELALSQQMDFVERVFAGEVAGHILICSHPPIVTLGRKFQEASDPISWTGAVAHVSRGGKATYHGPSQLVVYPILNLKKFRQDLHWFLRLLEQSLVECLAEFGIQAVGATPDTGVWIEGRKIASIGIAVKNWITYHGIAINVFEDPNAFQGLNPCGFQSSIMTSLEKELGSPWTREKLNGVYEPFLKKNLEKFAKEEISWI